jgi:AcrR family transcriptional regulator
VIKNSWPVLPMSQSRSYHKKARARSEAATGEAILDAAYHAFSMEPFGSVTLKQIADESGVTVQTVIRRFGSKEGLFIHLAKQMEKRIIPEREVPAEEGLSAALNALIRHYERDGDIITHLVNQENQFEFIRVVVNRGRQVHRQWVEKHCRHLLAGLTGSERTRMLSALIVATDLSTWKLLRRDYGHDQETVAGIMQKLLNGLNGDE